MAHAEMLQLPEAKATKRPTDPFKHEITDFLALEERPNVCIKNFCTLQTSTKETNQLYNRKLFNSNKTHNLPSPTLPKLGCSAAPPLELPGLGLSLKVSATVAAEHAAEVDVHNTSVAVATGARGPGELTAIGLADQSDAAANGVAAVVADGAGDSALIADVSLIAQRKATEKLAHSLGGVLAEEHSRVVCKRCARGQDQATLNLAALECDLPARSGTAGLDVNLAVGRRVGRQRQGETLVGEGRVVEATRQLGIPDAAVAGVGNASDLGGRNGDVGGRLSGWSGEG